MAAYTGPITIYYGDEIGMRYLPNIVSVEGGYSRTGARTPMQWDSSVNAGFSTADKTWLKVNSNYVDINVEKSKMQEQSVFEFYKTLLKLRKESKYKDVLINGLFAPEETKDPCVMAYRRYTDSENMIVYLNSI